MSAASSVTFVTLPMMPPEVTTVSPRRTFLINLLMLLHPLLLRPDDQEPHDDENQDEGNELEDDVSAAPDGAPCANAGVIKRVSMKREARNSSTREGLARRTYRAKRRGLITIDPREINEWVAGSRWTARRRFRR